ncbi:MAG: metal ABC transporter permease [Lachnospiraceae bacterium]|nr:metal ABC transporter permease [Lachnospiraceae bacterium]
MEKLIEYLSYPFVRYALVVGVLIALCSSLLGVTLVLKRFSFIGDGLSHVAFGAMSIAAVLGVTNNTLIVLPVTIVCAILLLKTGQNTKIKGDAAIAMISVGALAFGYLLMNLFSASSNLSGDVCSTLFGSTSILTLKTEDVWLSAVLAVMVVLFFIFFYHKIFDVTFDETFAKTVGTKVDMYNVIIAVIVAVVIVLSMNLVGSLLISALIIFPALSAMRLFHSFRSVTVCSAVLSVICAVVGILISITAGTPVGATIVAVDAVVFVVCYTVGCITGGKIV